MKRTEFLVATVPFAGEHSVGGRRLSGGYRQHIAGVTAAVHIIGKMVVGPILIGAPTLVVTQVKGRIDIVFVVPVIRIRVRIGRILLNPDTGGEGERKHQKGKTFFHTSSSLLKYDVDTTAETGSYTHSDLTI